MARKPKKRREQSLVQSDTQANATDVRHGVLLPAMVSAVLLWAAFAPVGWSLLAWVAPMGWLLVAEREKSVGRWGYFLLWLSGCAFWLATLQGIRLAFWPLYFGWVALSLYLAVYTPLFVGIVRTLRRRWSMPLVFAAPIAWVGLEQVRSYLLSGYAANTIAHTQALQPMVIQAADQFGGGGVSFAMVFVCAAVFQSLTPRGLGGLGITPHTPAKVVERADFSLVLATLMLATLLGYGWWKLAEADRLYASREPLLRVLLVQENTPTMFEINPDRNAKSWTRYLQQTQLGVSEHGSVDLVVWPESTFTANEPLMVSQLKPNDALPPELTRENIDADYLQQRLGELQRMFEFKIQRLLYASKLAEADDVAADSMVEARSEGPHLLVGCDAWVYRPESIDRYNSALFIGPTGQLLGRYAKMHLVMFGEYIPLGPALQWLGDMFGLAGVRAGEGPESFQVGEVRIAPNICFESMMPRLVVWQVQRLATLGEEPDILVNITNDSWFRGSSILDHHVACSVFCAVENRRPLLAAANTGLTLEIDGAGRIRQVTERLVAANLLAEPKADARWGFVQTAGYPLNWLCAIICSGALLIGLVESRRKRAS